MQIRITFSVIIVGVLFGYVPATPGLADQKRELTDTQLDLVTAGSASVKDPDEIASFEFVKATRSGRTISAAGSFKLVEKLDRATFGHLTLTDHAQSNLRSLININAVNSEVNILLNLNINIDSSVGSLNQFNINGILPRSLKRPGS